MAANAACPSDNWPATPTRRVSPTAPIAAPITNSPACSQKPDSRSGRARATTRSASPPIRRGSSDTDGLLAAQQTRGPHEQDDDHDDVRGDLAEAGAEEACEIALVAGDQGAGEPDEQAPHDGSGDR